MSDDDRAETLKPQWGEALALNRAGRWVPSIPEPLWVGFRLRKARCHCGRTLPSEEAYRGHYAYVHVVLGHGFSDPS